jgi:hypothetical protein
MHAVPWLHAAPVLPVPRDSMGRDLRLPAVYSNPPRPGFPALRRLVRPVPPDLNGLGASQSACPAASQPQQ